MCLKVELMVVSTFPSSIMYFDINILYKILEWVLGFEWQPTN